jgi:hypothetical protein
MAAILLCFVAVGGRVILREAGDYSRASAGVAAARLAQLTLTASTLVSFERGPTNAALGAESPVPAERRRPLEAARAATDQALDAITLRLAASDAREAAAITGPIISARRRLAAARQVIDGLLQRPLESRTDRELNGVIAEMIAVIQELSPALNTMEATLARADSSLTSLITAARLATDMRDYAGQLGSVFTAPLVAKRPMTAADTTKLDRIMGYLDALNEQFQLTYSKLDHDPAMDTALADVHTRFFGAGRTLVLQTAEIGRTSGSYGLSTAAFAAQYVPEMRPLVALRDAAVARFTRGIDLVLASTALSMKFHGFAVALALCVVGATYRVMHVRVSMPLIALTRVIDRLARRERAAGASPRSAAPCYRGCGRRYPTGS